MKYPAPLVALGCALGMVLSAQAQVLYTEAFDSEATANVVVNKDTDTVVRYLDYSSFTVGDQTFSISEAPNKLDGSALTSGVFLQTNLADGAPAAVNFLAASSPGGEPISVSGTYRLTFDCFISVHDPVPEGGTEQILWGVGTGAGPLYSRATRAKDSLSGMWGWLAGENGYGTSDTSIFNATEEVERKADGAPPESTDLWNAAFSTEIGGQVNKVPALAWTEVTIDVFSDVVRVLFNGELFHEAPITEADTTGTPLVGYGDPFGSISAEQNFQWCLIDNIAVEEIVEPALAIATDAPFEVITVPAGVSTANYSLTNKRDVALNLTEASVTGDDSGLFEVLTTLPLAIAPGETAMLDVRFNPGATSGQRTATLELITDDPDTPTTTLPLTASRFGELLAQFKFDETGNPATDASGNGTVGTYAAGRFEPGYEAPSLVGGAGSSITFTDAHASGTGNWAIFDVLHTPSVSLSMWIQPSGGEGTDVIFNRNDTASFVDSDGVYGLALGDDGALTMRVRDEDILVTDPDTIKDDTAYHIVFTHRDDDGFDNETAARSRLYINGEMVAEATGLNTVGFGVYPDDARATELYVGTRIAAGSGYAGAFDEFQAYRVELEPRQVTQLFNEPETSARFDNPNLFVSATGDFAIVAEGGPVSQVIKFSNTGASETLNITRTAVTGDNVGNFTFSELPTTLAPGETQEVTVTFDSKGAFGQFSATLEVDSNDENDSMLTTTLAALVPNPSGLLAHYKLDETSGDVLADASGNNRPARIRTEGGGTAVLGEDALANGTSIRLVGGDDSVLSVIEIPATASLPAIPTFTVSMWFEFDAADEDTASVLFSIGDSLEEAAALALPIGTAEQALQWIIQQVGGEVTEGELLKSRNPYHLVMTHTDTAPEESGADLLEFYINGVLVESIEEPVDALTSVRNTPILFGGVPGISGMVGRLDDLQLYETALSADDIGMLFENPGIAIGGPTEPEPTVDTDGDGLTDAEEAVVGTRPDLADSDGDGFSDGQEVAAKTDPLSRASQLAAVGVSSPDGTRTVTWKSQPDVTYIVEVSEDLVVWTTISNSAVAAAGETTSLPHADAPTGEAYYRVSVKTD